MGKDDVLCSVITKLLYSLILWGGGPMLLEDYVQGVMIVDPPSFPCDYLFYMEIAYLME